MSASYRGSQGDCLSFMPSSRKSSADMSATSSTATPTAGTQISTIIEQLKIASKRKAGETVIDVACITAEKFEELCSELQKHNNRRTEPDRLLSGHRMKLIDGTLIIYKFSRGAHEKITRRIDQMIAGQNVALSGDGSSPLSCFGSTRVQYGLDTSLEAASSLFNLHMTRPWPRAPNGEVFPLIVIELCDSESFDSLIKTVEVHLRGPVIQMVISIKVVRNDNDDVRELLCIVHYAVDQVENFPVRARQVISFGPTLHPATAQRIREVTHVQDAQFTGMGRPDCVRCDAPNIAMYQVGVPADVVWAGVDPAYILPHAGVHPYTLDLYRLVEILQESEGLMW